MITKTLYGAVLAALALTPSLALARPIVQTEEDKAQIRQFYVDKFSLLDLLKGDRLQPSYKPADLPDDFKAFKILAAGGGGLSDLFGSPLGLIMMMGGGGGRDAAVVQLFELLDISWTRGDVVYLYDRRTGEAIDQARKDGVATPAPQTEPFLVVYKADLGVAELRSLSDSPGAPMNVELKLQLVKFSSISAVTPRPEMTKQRLLEKLGVAKTAISTEPSTSDQARRTAALSNAKQIALGAIMFTADNDDYLPFVQSTAEFKAEIMPYIKNEAIWDTLSPSSRFLFNMCLSGVSLTAIPDPARTPLVYESAPYKDGTRIVAYADGHAQRLPESEWKSLGKYLKLKLPRREKKPAPK